MVPEWRPVGREAADGVAAGGGEGPGAGGGTAPCGDGATAAAAAAPGGGHADAGPGAPAGDARRGSRDSRFNREDEFGVVTVVSATAF